MSESSSSTSRWGCWASYQRSWCSWCGLGHRSELKPPGSPSVPPPQLHEDRTNGLPPSGSPEPAPCSPVETKPPHVSIRLQEQLHRLQINPITMQTAFLQNERWNVSSLIGAPFHWAGSAGLRLSSPCSPSPSPSGFELSGAPPPAQPAPPPPPTRTVTALPSPSRRQPAGCWAPCWTVERQRWPS